MMADSTPEQPCADASALADIATERRRQVEVEGWMPEHDDRHINGEMAKAAACYAVENREMFGGYWAGGGRDPDDYFIPHRPRDWPWHADRWKPSDRRRELVKAGALIVAEIERLDRLQRNSPPSTSSGTPK